MWDVPCLWVWGEISQKNTFFEWTHKKLLNKIERKEERREEKRSREVFINHNSTSKNVKIIKLNVVISPLYMCEFLIMYYFNYLKKTREKWLN
jgi:hypothetical protein